jgi:monovalent cation:H+ antiporter-2, CPA2 family
MDSELLILFVLLTVSVAGVALARRFGLPTMLAYLGIGIAVGPHGLKLLQESEQVKTLAEFGIVFLMFSIGLEFSLRHLNAMRGLVFGFGSAQMGLTAVGAGIVTWFGYGQGWKSGIAVGLAVAMSSTAIVARMLSERFELHSRSGRLTMGTLLFQDIAVVPCLILLPALARPDDNLAMSLSLAALEAAVMLTVMIWLGQRLIRRLYDRVAHHRSEELFILTTFWVVVGLSLATHHAGMSLALGAFVGGMLISETPYRHQVEADIRPFRDILLGFFFITVGMMLDLGFVFEHLHKLLLALVLLVGGKALVVMLLALMARNPLDTALRTSAQLAQGGEFGLVLISLARHLELIESDVFQVTLSAMLISMFLAPFLIERAARFSGELGKGDWAHKAKAIHDISTRSFGLEDHVIICGYGRTGQQIGEFLAIEGIPFLALDIDPQRIALAQTAGGTVVFGNADRSEVLQAAGLSRARGVAIAYPDRHSAERAVKAVRRKRQDVVIVVRAADENDVAHLKAAGATEVIPEVVEGSLMIAAETLAQIGVPMERAIAHVRSARAERYASLRSFYEDEAAEKRRT